MAGWQVLIDGEGTRDMRTISVLDTIAGAKKYEIVLRDVTNMNSFNHFDDVEIWAPAKNPPGGLIFDGTDDHIRCGNDSGLDATDSIAISAWIKTSDTATQFIVSKYASDADASYELYCSAIGTGGARFRLYDNSGGVNVNSNSDVQDGAWHHIVGTLVGTTMSIYVDGALKNTGTLTNDIEVTTNILNIGRRGNATTHFKGTIADVRIYDEDIDIDEISRLYNGKYTTACKAFYTLHQSSAEDNAIYDRFEFSHGTSYTGSSTKGALTVDTSPLNQFIAFKGRTETIVPDYDTNTLAVAGRDYTGSLLNRACVESYTTQLRSYIVNDILLKYGTSMTRRSIDNSPAGDTLSYLFKTSAWDAVVKCAKEDAYRFWTDVDKDFHYHEKGYKDSGITLELGVDDILDYNINEMGSSVVNMVTVYGKESGGTQIIAMVDDVDSQDYYGDIFEKRIVDISIETEADAITVGEKYLDEHSYVLEIVEMKLIGNQTLTAGELITLKIPDVLIDDTYLIIEKRLEYPTGITSIKVAKYAKNLEGLISDMVDKILMLERHFIEESSAVTKIHRVRENVLHKDLIILDRRASNDSFKIGVKNWCVIGETKIGGRGSNWTNVYTGTWQ